MRKLEKLCALALLCCIIVTVSACGTENAATAVAADISIEATAEAVHETTTEAITEAATIPESSLPVSDFEKEITLEKTLALPYWHGDANGDGVQDTSIRFFENGAFSAESEVSDLAEMEYWEFVENNPGIINFYNSEKQIQYTFEFDGESLTMADTKYHDYPMHQQMICGKYLYVTWKADFDSYLPETVEIYPADSGDILTQEAFFYYPGEMRDFKIYDLQYDFDIEGYQIMDTVFQKDLLTKDEAVLWRGYSGDLYTNMGFSFIDEEGNYRSFTVGWVLRNDYIHDPYTIYEQALHE